MMYDCRGYSLNTLMIGFIVLLTTIGVGMAVVKFSTTLRAESSDILGEANNTLTNLSEYGKSVYNDLMKKYFG